MLAAARRWFMGMRGVLRGRVARISTANETIAMMPSAILEGFIAWAFMLPLQGFVSILRCVPSVAILD